MIELIVEGIKKLHPYYNYLDQVTITGVFNKIEIEESGDDYKFTIETKPITYIKQRKIIGIINDPTLFRLVNNFFQKYGISKLVIFIKRRNRRELYYVKAQRKEVKIIA